MVDAKAESSSSLFEVNLRLRPRPEAHQRDIYPELPSDRIITIEENTHEDKTKSSLSYVTIQPPANSRKRAVERFAFSKIFAENASQSTVFENSGIISLIDGVINGNRDGLFATLGVTGSGKSHTILGTKSQRGMIQLSLDLIFRAIAGSTIEDTPSDMLLSSLLDSETAEGNLISTPTYLASLLNDQPERMRLRGQAQAEAGSLKKPPLPTISSNSPDIEHLSLHHDLEHEYIVLASMYEVYNDRIFDLLASNSAGKDVKRRALLFKNTDASPDRKVVAGLRKVVCSSYKDAIMVLEGGLLQRRVAGTGSNSVSSRSHGFFCVEIKKRRKTQRAASWSSTTLTIVDLAGSERARQAKTAGTQLAEAGKINESLMYLGQCLQMQSDQGDPGSKPAMVPFRQCKLTELLFSNSFPSHSNWHAPQPRNPQKAVMIVTADPHGDFNATSQILRYSALAREVTVPRIPSVTIAMHQPSMAVKPTESSRSSPTPTIGTAEFDAAIERANLLQDELEIMATQLAAERIRRRQAEQAMVDIETRLRNELWEAMEARIEIQRRGFMAHMAEESERQDEYLDRKLDLLASGLNVQDEILPQSREADLERENTLLRGKIDVLERQLQNRSPTKTKLARPVVAKSNAMQMSSKGRTSPERRLQEIDANSRNSISFASVNSDSKVQYLSAQEETIADDELF